MTRAEIERRLSILTDESNDFPAPDALGVRALAEIVADQEHRLRLLEPCPKTFGGPHQWDSSGANCVHCALSRVCPW